MTTIVEQPTIPALPEAGEVAAETAPEDSLSEGVNWAEEAGGMGDEEGLVSVEGDVEVLAEPEAAAPAAAPAPAPAPAPATPTPEQAPPAPVAATPEPVIQAPVAPVAPTLPAPEPFDMGKWEKEQLGNLEQLYAISPEDAEKLNTEPEIILPKMAANMHMMVTKSLLTAVQGMIPEIVAGHTQQMNIEREARETFYKVNPDLAGHEAAVLQVGKIFRAANPTAPREVAIKTIGDMVRHAL